MDLILFETRPGIAMLLRPDSPKFTVLAVSNDFLRATGFKKEDVIGKGHFELAPPNPDAPQFSGEEKIRACYAQLLQNKQPNQLPLQRYDLRQPNGSFLEKYWTVINTPVLSETGEVRYIIHTAEDKTLHVTAKKKSDSIHSIEKAYHFFMSAPVIIGLLLGDDYIIEMANEGLLEVWDRNSTVIGQPIFKAIPELEEQGFEALLEQVRISGEPFYANEFPITLFRHGKEELIYFDFVYKPFYTGEGTGKAEGVISVGHDVTSKVNARKEMEASKKEIEEQRRLYETINGNTPDLIYVFGLDYRFQYANQALLNMWGKTQEEAFGKSLLENGYEPWHAEMHEREIDDVVANKRSVRGEVSFPHATQGKRVYDYILVPVLDNDGTVVAVAGTTRDITEINMAQENIRESNDRFRNLADNSPMFVFMIELGAEAPVTYWNKTWLEYTGQTLEQASGRAWEGVIHPEDIEIVTKHYAPAYKDQTAYFIPAVRVKRHDNVHRWHSFQGNPRYDVNGNFAGYVGVGYDVHDQKLAAEALIENEAILKQKVAERTVELENQKNLFDNILKNSSNGITVSQMIRDDEGRIIDARTIMANDAAVKYIGLGREEFLSLSAVEMDPNIFESDYGKTCLVTLQTGEPSLSQYYIEKTGRWQELTISKMDDDHLIHIFTDVTPIKNAQLQLEHMIEELKHSNTNLEEFAYAASHDLKEPIRKIQVFSDRLKNSLKDKLGAEEQSFFQRMELASNRMNTLIDDLLEYSSVSKGAVLEDDIDLSKVLVTVLEDLDMEIEQKKARIAASTLPVIRGNQRQVQQLFQNLLSNALKYSRQGLDPLVTINAVELSANDPLLSRLPHKRSTGYYLIQVEDNGIGFAREDSERIFNVFTRLHGNSEYKGSGVGLSIVRKVVENHSGHIWAEAVPGGGATFKMLFPVV